MSYSSDDSGNASGTLRVQYGYGVSETLGRLLVLHDSSGARISCEVIGQNGTYFLSFSLSFYIRMLIARLLIKIWKKIKREKSSFHVKKSSS